ncbi:MAG: hypothetical protein KAJ62_06510 [Desulfobacteraceae bacterium]|nr:hypothetical protein [Desulfobacteraceae bacterium]
MEDISRELEKEIESYSSPVRNKRKTETRYIAVDDFGSMKSADWIKKALLSLSVLCLVLFATTFLFYKLYANYKIENTKLQENLNSAEKKVKDSIKEKEFLMAKLVISDNNSVKPVEEEQEIKDDIKKVIESKVVKVVKKRQKSAQGATPPVADTKPAAPEPLPSDVPKVVSSQVPKTIPSEIESTPENIKNVGIERFMIVKDDVTGDLLVNFRVINIASEKGDASGRVFVLLSSKDGSEVNKLVVPTVALKDNIPTVPRRGQYFSIAHFKTVKFKIPNIPNPELFTKATVYVFGKGNALIVNEAINISIGK